MIKIVIRIVCTLSLLALIGCASTKTGNQSTDLKKAATLNSELGNGYLGQGKLELAKNKFEKALAQDPGLPAAHAGYGLLWSRLGDSKKADKHFKTALKKEPYNSTFLNNYGTFLCGQNRIEEAEKRFLAALRDPLYQTPEYAYTNAGLCSLKIQNFDKAEAYFGKALSENSRFPDALLQMSIINYEYRRNYKLSSAYLEKFEQYGSHSPESLWLAIRLSSRLGNKNDLASYKLLLKNKYPESSQAARLLKLENR